MALKYDIRKNWKTWSHISHSDFYCGVHRGVEDYCESYVSVEDWLRHQEREVFKATPSGRTYIFRGLMRCECCGHKLCGDGNKKSYGVYKSYRCVNRSRGCTAPSAVSELNIEKQLLARLDQDLRDEIARVELEARKPKPKPKLNVKSLKERQRRLTVAYTAGGMSDDDYIAENKEILALIKKAEKEEPEKPKDVAPLKELLETDFRSIYEGFDEEEKQRFWTGLIKEIKLDGKKIKDVIFF